MDTAKMSQLSDDANSSDDLIAELARLMADEARGEPDARQAENSPAASPLAANATQRERRSTPAGDMNGSDRTSQVANSPHEPTGSRSPSARLDASRGSDALYETDDMIGDDPVPLFSPTFRRPDARTGLLRESRAESEPESRNGPEDAAANSSAPTGGAAHGDAFADAFRNRRRMPAEAPQAASMHLPGGNAAPPASEVDAVDDPIGALISAQLDSGANASNGGAQQHQAHETQSAFAPGDVPGEADSFSTSPVFGVGGGRNTHEPAAGANDPLADIETLIGDAVNMDVQEVGDDRQLHPPRRREPGTFDDDVNGAATAAEAAIMAATASVSAERRVSRPAPAAAPQDGQRLLDEIDLASAEPIGETAPFSDQIEGSRRRPLWARLMAPTAAGLILVVIGFGLYWVFGPGPVPESGEAPVLAASTEPVKEVPENTTDSSSDVSKSVVFNELEGKGDAVPTENLVSRDSTQGASGSEVDRVIAEADPSAESVTGLANRKVRTVTVRPDGTIVSSDDTTAGSEVLPVDRPNVPALPAGSSTAASQFANDPIITETPGIVPSGTAAAASADDTAATLRVASVDGLATGDTVVAPRPRPRLTDRTAAPSASAATRFTVASASTEPASASPTSSTNRSSSGAVDLIAGLSGASKASSTSRPASVAAISQPAGAANNASAPDTIKVTTGASAPAYVQLSSQREEAAAANSLSVLQGRYANLLTGDPLEVQKADLGDKGVYYRVRMPASSLEAATRVCTNIKAQGGDCFVRTN